MYTWLRNPRMSTGESMRSRIRTTKVYLSDIDEMVRCFEPSIGMGVHCGRQWREGRYDDDGRKTRKWGRWVNENKKEKERDTDGVTSQQTLHKLWKKQVPIHFGQNPTTPPLRW